MQRFLLAKRAWVVLFAVVCALYFYGLGGVPLVGPDEPRYAEVAREMFTRGDLVTPTLGGHIWFEKPALVYWLMMAAYRVFGVTEFAARAGSALAGVVTVLLVGWAARRAEFEAGERLRGFGIACAAVSASSAGLLAFARAASFDVVLTATVTAALACFYVSEVERGAASRRRLLAGFYACTGLSLLAKGLVGVVIPAGVVAVYFIARRRWPARLGVWWGAPLALAVAATWYAPVWLRHGRVFFEEFIVQQHFARYVSDKYHHAQPFYFFLPVVLMLALPWTLFLFNRLAASGETNARADDAGTKLRVLALVWLFVPVLFFSASGSKLPGYVLPALPGAALLAGAGVHRYLRGTGGVLTMRLTGALALLLSAAAWVYFYATVNQGAGEWPSGKLPLGCLLAVTLPAGACGLLALVAARRRALCFACVAGTTLLTVALIVGCALGAFAERETVGRLLLKASGEGYGSLPVVGLHTVERTAEFYAAGRLAYDGRGEPLKLEGAAEVAEFARQNGGRALVLVPVKNSAQLGAEQGMESSYIGDNGSVALFLVRVGGSAEARP
ncbi:MAG TPA: glycosyltransferase family 39 protein [Pyrinomonadaceae bacterium]|nr:glycosyltransferase family 39 protein [Pyrinomonadaceae bacterium]